VDAFRLVHQRGGHRLALVLAGDGPELPLVREKAMGLSGITILGAVPHEAMPATLAASDVGVAPFDVAAHAPLALDFYWSPLKVFEYMASGLPVVAPRIPRLAGLVADGEEGVLYEPPTAHALADAIESLLDDERRRRMGAAARARAAREYSWSAHCEALDHAFRAALDRRPRGAAAP
jgi:glycosyltransferase involved in cell wall biosynthesis